MAVVTYETGNTLTWSITTTSDGSTLADLGGGNPTAVVTLPDGTTTSAATVTKVATGTYVATLASTIAGRYRIKWSGSGANSDRLPFTDHADVIDPASQRFIVPLATARAALNVPASVRVDDDELRAHLVGAAVVVEHICGALLLATKTHTASGGGRPAIALYDLPNSVTTVTEDGTSLTEGSGFCWDEHGLVWRGSRPHAATWSSTSPRNVAITYSVGDGVIPQNVINAAADLVAHWWRQGQQGYRPQSAYLGDDEPTTMVAGYAVPNWVADRLQASVSPLRRSPV